jgi:hypothetical protein
MNSLDFLHASASSALMDAPSETTQLISQYPRSYCRCPGCLVLPTWSVSMMSSFLVNMSCPPQPPSPHAAAALLAESADEIPISRNSSPALVLCESDDV